MVKKTIMNLKTKQKLSGVIERVIGKRLAYSIRYYHNRGKWPNLKNPQDLSEILISRIINNDFEKYSVYADKITVREYVKSKGLENNLLKHYFYWDKVEDINEDLLPDNFVLKTNNGAGGKNIFVCRDKSRFDFVAAKKGLNNAMHKVYEYEAQYNKIPPRIICEELIDTGSDAWPTDYKFTCINGTPVDIFIGTGRETGVKFCTKNLDWSPLAYTKKSYLPAIDPEKPKHLDKMIEIAKILSEDFDFVRVDLYEYKNQVYFGELTFSPWGGIMYSYTDEAILEYGKKLSNK